MRMLRASCLVYGMLGLVATLQVARAEAVYDSLSFSIPSENRQTKWFKALKLGKPAVLRVTVTADPGYEITSRDVQSHPPQTSVTGFFVITVPETMPEGSYTFKFKGKYRPIGVGVGPPPQELPWHVTAMLAIDKCDYEASGTELLDPPVTPEIKFEDKGIKFYNINVPPKGHRMGDVNAQLHSPEAGWIKYWHEWGGSRKHMPTDYSHDCPKCEDPCCRHEIWYNPLKLTFKGNLRFAQVTDFGFWNADFGLL